MLTKFLRYCPMVVVVNFMVSTIFTAGMAEELNMPIYVSQPKEVIIYEGDFALVKDIAQIEAQDTVQVELPAAASLKSLKILDSGKRIQFFTSSKIENQQPSYPIYYDQQKSVSTACGESPYIPNVKPYIISWKTDTKGKREIVLEYRINGINWTPAYILKLLNTDTATFTYGALITNSAIAIENAKISLASGESKKQAYRDPYFYNQRMTAELAAIFDITKTGDIQQNVLPMVNAQSLYDLGKIKLDMGTTSIELLNTEVNCKKEFIWSVSFGQRVYIYYAMKNTTNLTLPEGPVDVYQNDTYIGTDGIQFTPPGQTANITFYVNSGIKVDKTINVKYIENRERNANHHEAKLNLENLSDKEMPVRIFDIKYSNYSSSNEIEYSIKPNKETEDSISWVVNIPAREKKTILYDFYSNNVFNDPYNSHY